MKWVILIAILVVATIVTGGLDLPAVALATAIWYFFNQRKK
jgi:hypothetical protein